MPVTESDIRRRAFVWFERTVLGIGMSVMALVIERRLIKAIKAGALETRPAAPDTGNQRNVEVARSAPTRDRPVPP
jgi:hypothetical protein